MIRPYFLALEKGHPPLPLDEVIDQLAFDSQGLIPVITQDATSGQVLMFAWMNRSALEHTITHQRMTYWSRSREQLWCKGETSGHIQQLISMSFDCDGDAILCQVEQRGAACHTGRQSCFYLKVDNQERLVQVTGTAEQLTT
ncbi:phosphoribosyl-AMP cyclohydrolase [Gilvimarinus agarilyticus]|uniref:phosphoribosyl-AMP cyclohydrolase n=1 Tax=unclassified Gilvimarinus TaxID=2642066 RepID=UPI001C094C35|nr:MULTISPECIES: phosphoribosyl-AMP cyclohydrolase [unclassified Gilvimarinus]MBU2884359.1 phosphoribosyl-AMP cyclohydrolase [Gilvimarinus agarilyticus]MDO6569495.1 phosphoribosyl-AMP cyclohydrolase [Gilvimarinus sp. 2_MG-2023]MDO6748169.1 phosphoribosyl-AMP cyclohydrolase [Gilvimarinus sp. 1_MG-2023]